MNLRNRTRHYLLDPFGDREASAEEMCLPGLLADIKQRLTLPTLPPGGANVVLPLDSLLGCVWMLAILV